MPAAWKVLPVLLFLLLPASSAASPTVSLNESSTKIQATVKGNGGVKNIIRARLRSQGAVFALTRKGKRLWVSRQQQKPASLESLYGRRVAVLFQKQSRRWVVFKVGLAARPVEPEDPEDPKDPEEPIPSGVSASGLQPAWSREQTDYTVSCTEPTSLEVRLSEAVSLNGGPAREAFRETLPLQPGQAFTLSGAFGEHSFRCRPADLPLPKVSGRGSGSFYLVTPTLFGTARLTNYAMILDGSGVPVWWYRAPSPLILDLSMPRPGELAWVHARNGPGGFSYSDYTLQNLQGDFIDSISTVGFGADHHDLQPTSDGGWLLLGYVPRNCPAVPAECIDLSPWGGPEQATAIDGWVQKIDSNGNPLWTWKSQDHIDLQESDTWIPALGSGVPLGDGRQGYDIVHLNSVEEDGDGFIFSARHLDAVYRVDDAAGAGTIDWKLGGTETPESLQILEDPFGTDPLGGQHDARVLEDGTITIHDNGTGKSRPPRMVRYSVESGQATLLSQISDPSITASFCCGGGRVLPGGDGWAVSWGANSLVAEYNLDGSRRLAMTWPDGKHSYRVVPVSPTELSLGSLRAGMNAQVFLP